MQTKTHEFYQIDKVDKDILLLLIKDAFIPYTEIAKKLIISSGTVHVRMNKLKEIGIVKGVHIEIDAAKLGYDICAFLGIFLTRGSAYHDVVTRMKTIPEIVELHYTTGTYSMFAKIICRDTKHLREVLNEKIQEIKAVERTETFISLEESISRQVKL